MFQRLSRMKEPLQSALAILNPDSVEHLTNEDWYNIDKSSEILSVVEEVTREMSREKNVTLSKIALLSKALLNHCQRLKEFELEGEIVCSFITKLAEEASSRMDKKYGDLGVVLEATLLDPRL